VPKQTSSQSEPFSFRIPTEDREWLDSTAKANGVEVAQIVRWAVIAIKQYIEAHGGRIHLPLDIRTMWEQKSPHFPALHAAEDSSAAVQSPAADAGNFSAPRKRAGGK
jgi:hypothetical protein